MKTIKTAYAILIFLTVAVTVNSFTLKMITNDLREKIEAIDVDSGELAASEYEKVFKEFEKDEKYISLTVSHDDLTNIEESFAELIGAANANNSDDIMKARSRLIDALKHLGRLSGINIDSIM